MEAKIVDLRYKMNDVLKALERNERVSIKYRGKIKGIILASIQNSDKKIQLHPLFGMYANEEEPVENIMDKLRGSR